MRTLTIKRKKSFVACLGKFKVYAEDRAMGDTEINGVPCRLLGELKNDSEASFTVSDDAMQIYVIAGLSSKGYCFDSYPLPAGTEDVYLTGKAAYNPAAGNPFRFDGVTDETIIKARKKNNVKGILIFVGVFIISFIAAFALTGGLSIFDKASPKVFSCADMTITLTDDFFEDDIVGSAGVFTSADALVYVVCEDYDEYEPLRVIDMDQYIEMVRQNNPSLTDTEIKTDGGLRLLEYDAESGGKDYHWFVYVFRSDKGFRLVEFSVFKKNAEKMRDTVTGWAKSVTFEK